MEEHHEPITILHDRLLLLSLGSEAQDKEGVTLMVQTTARPSRLFLIPCDKVAANCGGNCPSDYPMIEEVSRLKQCGKARLVLVTILVGADIQEIDEVRASIETFGDRYVRRIFTDYEIEECCKNSVAAAPALASRFAAKEAVFKILKDDDVVATWQEIEVRHLESGQPVIVLRGGAAELATRQGIVTISLSLSQSGGTAAAVVVAQSATGSND